MPSGQQLDLVPFGGLEVGGTIAWPAHQDQRMDVRGLQEAHAHAERFLLPGGLDISAPSLECFVCLKLLAWSDRHHDLPRHDSADLALVLRNADLLVGLDELYQLHATKLEQNDFDVERTALELVGMKLGEVLFPATRGALVSVLRTAVDESGRLELVRELTGFEALPLLRSLLRGLEGS